MKKWIGILAFLCTIACQKKAQTDKILDFFYVQNKQVYMPVWVQGNPDSDKIILVLHGGPGGDGSIYKYTKAFQNLEKDYIVVYFDQRGSGASQGYFGLSDYNNDSYVKDLDKLVFLIAEKYGKTRDLILLGHSWGGMLGAAFLIQGKQKHRIRAWINNDGIHKTFGNEEYRRIKEVAIEQIRKGNSMDFWQKTLQSLAKIDTNNISKYDISTINNLGYNGENRLTYDHVIEASSVPGYYDYLFNSSHYDSSYEVSGLITNIAMFDNHFNKDVDLSKDLYKITQPTLFLWGNYDLVVAKYVAYEAFEYMTNAQVKYIHYFQKSGHSAMLSEPDSYVATLKTFFQRLDTPDERREN